LDNANFSLYVASWTDLVEPRPSNDFGSRELQGRMDVINNNEGINAFIGNRPIDVDNLVTFSLGSNVLEGFTQCPGF